MPPQNRLGSLVPYDTPPPSQSDTPTSNTQTKTLEKGPQAHKRKRAASKPDGASKTPPPPGHLQTQKKARPSQEELEVQNAISSPPNQQKETQPPPPPNPPFQEKTPQPFSLPDLTGHKSPSLPPSPTEEAWLRKKTQTNPPLLGKSFPIPTRQKYNESDPPQMT